MRKHGCTSDVARLLIKHTVSNHGDLGGGQGCRIHRNLDDWQYRAVGD